MSLLVVGFAFVVSCKGTPEQKEDKLNEEIVDVSEAKKDLNEALTDSINNYEAYKSETKIKLQENARLIATFKDKKPANDNYKKQVAALEQDNEKLKAMLDGFQQGNEDQWEQFKLDFNTRLDQLKEAISELEKRNKE